jgi:hypothetical protein
MMLEVERIDSFYGETQVLFDVSLHVGEREVVALLGANGAGSLQQAPDDDAMDRIALCRDDAAGCEYRQSRENDRDAAEAV